MIRDILNRESPAADFRISYGPQSKQFCDLRVAGHGTHIPVAIVIHGGFWRSRYNLTYMGHLCEALRLAGIATYNVEYRGTGDPGGGWPGTLDDMTAAAAKIRSVSRQYRLDMRRVITVGHSAGGQLALWLASKISVRGCVVLGGVADLRRAWELNLGEGAVEAFLGGGPNAFPERFRHADPASLLPLGTPQRLFHGREDSSVPIEIAERYVAVARLTGDEAEVIALDGGHFEPVDPETPQGRAVTDEISRMVMSSSSSAV
jgi:acetyl esterase/lipase